MPKLTFEILNVTQSNLDITQYVQSLNFTIGRPSPLSPYSGNSASITMFSYGGTETSVAINDEILFKATATGSTAKNLSRGKIASRSYNDEPGTGLNSTMTVLINDSMLQAGMLNLISQSLVQTTTQIQEIDGLYPQIQLSTATTQVEMSTGTFSVNANQRINEIIAGDRGQLRNNVLANTLYQAPEAFDVTTTVTIGQTTSATQIAYQDLVRVEAASNSLFYTQATVTGSASTETKSSEALATYGTRTFTATTAQSNLVAETAEWYANAFSDPYAEQLLLSFSDIAQTTEALKLFNAFLPATAFVQVSYTPPGGVLTTGYYWPEQITVNATTSQTVIDMVMTPLTYYANFILDDTVFGVLDTDRLGV